MYFRSARPLHALTSVEIRDLGSSFTPPPPLANKDTPDTARRIIINIVYYVYDIPCHCWSDKLVSIDRISYTNTKFPAPSQQWQSLPEQSNAIESPLFAVSIAEGKGVKNRRPHVRILVMRSAKKNSRGEEKTKSKEKKQRRKDRLRPKTPLVRSRNSC